MGFNFFARDGEGIDMQKIEAATLAYADVLEDGFIRHAPPAQRQIHRRQISFPVHAVMLGSQHPRLNAEVFKRLDLVAIYFNSRSVIRRALRRLRTDNDARTVSNGALLPIVIAAVGDQGN